MKACSRQREQPVRRPERKAAKKALKVKTQQAMKAHVNQVLSLYVVITARETSFQAFSDFLARQL
jgi:hypothetical protein